MDSPDHSDYLLDRDIYSKVEDLPSGSIGPLAHVYHPHSPTPENPRTDWARRTIPQSLSNFVSCLDVLTQTLPHPALARFHGFTLSPERTLSLEFLDSSLSSIFSGNPQNRCWGDTEKSIVTFGVAAAMMHLHAHGFSNGHLNPNNILFTKSGDPKIVDFCFGEFTSHSNLPEYTAPEGLSDDNHQPADVFAYGMLLFQIATGRSPGRFPPAIPDDVPNLVAGIFEACVRPAAERPRFYHVVHALMETVAPPFPNANRTVYNDYKTRVFAATLQSYDAEAVFELPLIALTYDDVRQPEKPLPTPAEDYGPPPLPPGFPTDPGYPAQAEGQVPPPYSPPPLPPGFPTDPGYPGQTPSFHSTVSQAEGQVPPPYSPPPLPPGFPTDPGYPGQAPSFGSTVSQPGGQVPPPYSPPPLPPGFPTNPGYPGQAPSFGSTVSQAGGQLPPPYSPPPPYSAPPPYSPPPPYSAQQPVYAPPPQYGGQPTVYAPGPQYGAQQTVYVQGGGQYGGRPTVVCAPGNQYGGMHPAVYLQGGRYGAQPMVYVTGQQYGGYGQAGSPGMGRGVSQIQMPTPAPGQPGSQRNERNNTVIASAPGQSGNKRNLGWAEKKGGMVLSWKKRYFVLSGNLLQYFEHEGTGLKGSVNLSKATKVVIQEDKILITTPGRCWEVKKIEGNIEEWVQAIKEACPKIH